METQNPYKEAIKKLGLSYPEVADLAESYGVSMSLLTGRNRGQYIGRIANGMVSATDNEGSLSAVGAALDHGLSQKGYDPVQWARWWVADAGIQDIPNSMAKEYHIDYDGRYLPWAKRLEIHQRLVRMQFLSQHGQIGYDYVIGAGWRAFAGVGLKTQYSVAKALQVPITWVQAWDKGEFYPAMHSAVKEALRRG